MILTALRGGLADIRDGLRRRRVWVALANEDIGDQHRLTTLGPIWLLLNYLLFVGTFVFLFGRGDSVHPDYAAYAATGLFVWLYLSEVVGQGVTLFIREQGFIQGTTLPLFVYVMRLTMQCVIRAGYALIGCLGILSFYHTAPFAAWLWSAAGMLLNLVITPAIVVLMGFLGVYFPDAQFLVSNLLRVGMFLTPIFWYFQGADPIQHVFYYWNPFTYLLEIVRMPLISGHAPVMFLIVSVAGGTLLWALAIFLLGRFGKRVAFAL